ncbi:molybdenum hydroxylase accessory protein, YgfJ family [Candidatus Vecturithrix granuli]|uniref:Molybdenum hydroxylase accessory protein, YgfJ family n=1 Tax=Vecturithrix granuli TaxID=1499967 RepID=A0A081C6G8_VECG1|nr:molybdenum hydroxylase accessory protein, YgfJ family [Candidatus Vecturithrix granuli]
MNAIILAAGFSSRMGTLKQVMAFEDKPMTRQVAEPLLAAGLELIVVIGHERERVKSVLQDLPCKYVLNPCPEDGMFSSVRMGCLTVPAGEACLLTPCDCPGIRPETIRQVQITLEREREKVIIPTFQGRRGHPAGLPAMLVERIRTLPPDTPGLNSLWREQPEMVVHLEIPDPAILRDFDRPEDF